MGLFKNLLFGETLNAYYGTNKGKKRVKNEDNYYLDGIIKPEGTDGNKKVLQKTKMPSNRFTYYAVFDGMGGGDFGEIASFIAAKATSEFLSEQKNIDLDDISESLNKLCEHLSAAVFKTGSDLGAYQMGTTLVSFFFYNNHVWVCNIGDSKGFYLSNGKLIQLTKDHIISSDHYHKKPSLSQFVGVDPRELRLEPYISRMSFKKGDTYLLCSDGLTDMVSEEDVLSVLSENIYGDKKVEKLIDMAMEAGGIDNITVILIEVL